MIYFECLYIVYLDANGEINEAEIWYLAQKITGFRIFPSMFNLLAMDAGILFVRVYHGPQDRIEQTFATYRGPRTKHIIQHSTELQSQSPTEETV